MADRNTSAPNEANADRLIARLEKFCLLSEDEKQALRGAMSPERQFAAGEDLVHERRPVEGMFVIVDGIACRYKLLPDGRRQIVGLLLPGDMCDLRVFLLRRMDHSISALTPVRAVLIPAAVVTDMMERHMRLTRALWWTTIVEDSVTREWVVNVGSRTAFERVGHLFCEVFWRLEAVGLVRGAECELPLTQSQLGDMLALSSVHVNRTLKHMRNANLVKFQNGRLELLDRKALTLAVGFHANYLHLEGGNPYAFAIEGADEAIDAPYTAREARRS
jgi:CRP-like cAMP-binding protein